jgi:hypothetical protein
MALDSADERRDPCAARCCVAQKTLEHGEHLRDVRLRIQPLSFTKSLQALERFALRERADLDASGVRSW